MRELSRSTLAVSAGRPDPHPGAPINAPIVLSATFHAGDDDANYLRHSSSDTIRAFEAAIGALEGGDALAFSSGMAATAAIVEGLPVGGVVVVPQNVYSATSLIFAEQERLGRLSVRRVDITDTEDVLEALPGAGLLWVETPTNPLVGVADLPALTAAARREGALICVDSTWNSPIVLRPLEHGADIVMHSATKYLAGHSDLLMGVLVTDQPELRAQLRSRRDLTGAIPGALETYLALRGVRTLAVRMERAQANAMELATRLTGHRAVLRVRYPGLPDDPGHERASRLHDGFGAMISFEVDGGADRAEAICDQVQVITNATSLGGVESLIERRAKYPVDAANGTPDNLIRFSVGIEDVEDLWADLVQALDGSADDAGDRTEPN
jgi:cystathionine gamma-synthase